MKKIKPATIKAHVRNHLTKIKMLNLDIDELDRKRKQKLESIGNINSKIGELQANCDHEFPDKPTCMGRGICKICGYSDY